MEKENITLATEMLKELKSNSKRWFLIAVIELFIILSMAGLFVWYINTPEEETSEVITSYTQEADTEGDNSAINQQIGE